MLLPSMVPDFKYEFDTLVDFYEKELKESDAELVLETEATPEIIRREAPDVLVIAIGGESCVPSIKGLDAAGAYAAVDLLNGIIEPRGQRAVIIGGGEVGCETALWLRRQDKDVSVIEILDELMSLEEMKYHTVVLERMMVEEGVNIYTGSKAVEVIDGTVKIRDADKNIIEIPADFIVYSVGFKSPVDKINAFRNTGVKEIYVIGDANEPHKIREAVHDAYRIGDRYEEDDIPGKSLCCCQWK